MFYTGGTTRLGGVPWAPEFCERQFPNEMLDPQLPHRLGSVYFGCRNRPMNPVRAILGFLAQTAAPVQVIPCHRFKQKPEKSMTR